jgi:hypothetical protein
MGGNLCVHEGHQPEKTPGNSRNIPGGANLSFGDEGEIAV